MARAVGRILEFIEAVKGSSLDEIRVLCDSFTPLDETKCFSEVDGNGYTAVLATARYGSTDVLDYLWEKSADQTSHFFTDRVKGNLWTPVLLVSLYQKADILKWFWAKSHFRGGSHFRGESQDGEEYFFVDRDGTNGNTAFMLAAANGNVEALEWLWRTWPRHYTFLAQKSHAGDTAFMLAAGNGKTEALEWLWETCTDKHRIFLAQTSKLGDTAFMLAAANGKVQALEWLWETCTDKRDIFLTQKAYVGNTAFMLAAANGKVQALEWLWETCTDKRDTFLAQSNNYGHTVFMLAAYTGKVEALEWLWETCTDQHHTFLAQKSTAGAGAFLQAAGNGKTEALEWLWETCTAQRDTFLSETDHAGNTAFILAAANSKTEALEWLWETCTAQHDTFLSETDHAGNTAFLIAAYNGETEALEWLWETCTAQRDTFLSETDHAGNTTFMLAAANGKVEALKWLWETCTDQHDTFLAHTNDNGKSASDLLGDRTDSMCIAISVDVKLLRGVWEKCTLAERKDFFYRKYSIDTTGIFTAAVKGDEAVLEFLWQKADTIQKAFFFSLSDNRGSSFISLSAQSNTIGLRWLWSKANDLQKEVFFTHKDNDGNTPVFCAVNGGNMSALDFLWEKSTTSDEKRDRFFTDTARDGLTSLNLAMDRKKLGVVNWLCKKVLSVVDVESGVMVTHTLVKIGNTSVLESMWPHFTQEQKILCLTAPNVTDDTIFHIAVNTGNIAVLDFIYSHLHQMEITEDVVSRLDWKVYLLSKNSQGNTVFHLAAFHGRKEVLDWLWEKTDDTVKSTLLSEEIWHTIFHLAAMGGSVEIIDSLWEKTDEDKRVDLLKSINPHDLTAFYLAAEHDKAEACRWLWEKCDFNKLVLFTSMEKVIRLVTKPFLSEYISLLRDQDGSTILHLLVSKQEKEMLAFAMTQDALKAICGVKENVTGKTCYHLASESDNEDIMKALLEVEDIYRLDIYTGYETAEKYKKVLLLECGRRYILKAIEEKKLAEVVQLVSILFDDSVPESLIVPLSEARGGDGKTVMHVAIESENLKSLGLLLRLPNTQLREIKDSTDKSCYDLLVSSHNQDMIKLVLGIDNIEDIELYRGYRELPATKQVILEELGVRYLFKLVIEGSQTLSLELIDDILPIDLLSSKRSTENLKLIHLVALRGRLEILKHMLTKEAFSEQIDEVVEDTGNTALHYGVLSDNVLVVRELLLEGADIWKQNVEAENCLDLALYQENEEIGKTLLFESIRRGDMGFISSCVEKLKLFDRNWSEYKQDGIPLINYSMLSFSDNPTKLCEVMRLLIREGASLSLKDDTSQKSAMHIAVEIQHLEEIKILLDKNPSMVNIQDGDGNTPLHIAISARYIKGVGEFLRHAQVIQGDIENNDGKTATQVAEEVGGDMWTMVQLAIPSVSMSESPSGVFSHLVKLLLHQQQLRQKLEKGLML